jgi:hypothetical protein
MNMPVLQTESTRAREVENVAIQVSVQEDVEGLIRKVALLEGALAKLHQAREVAEEKFRSLSDVSVDGVRWLVVSEMEHREQFEELFLLRAWSAELCLANIGPSQVRTHLSVRMRAAALRHTKMAGAGALV